jgi:hypothetical protein
VVDAAGAPIVGSTVTLAVTGPGATASQPAPTDASGGTTGTLTATEVGDKTVAATANGVPIKQTATVTVTLPPAASMAPAVVRQVGDLARLPDVPTGKRYALLDGASALPGGGSDPTRLKD